MLLSLRVCVQDSGKINTRRWNWFIISVVIVYAHSRSAWVCIFCMFFSQLSCFALLPTACPYLSHLPLSSAELAARHSLFYPQPCASCGDQTRTNKVHTRTKKYTREKSHNRVPLKHTHKLPEDTWTSKRPWLNWRLGLICALHAVVCVSTPWCDRAVCFTHCGGI